MPAIVFLPSPGYMVSKTWCVLMSFHSPPDVLFAFGILLFVSQFGKAIVCSDAAAEAARYGFTAVDRPEGFLVLAVASLGEQVRELASPPKV